MTDRFYRTPLRLYRSETKRDLPTKKKKKRIAGPMTLRITHTILSHRFFLTHQKDIEKEKKFEYEKKEMSGLSDKKKKEFIEAFSLFDKDGDKKISEEELANVSIAFHTRSKTCIVQNSSHFL